MIQRNEVRYDVSNGERVTVRLVAINTGDTAVFTTAPVTATQIASSPRTYEFTAQGGSGDRIFGLITCDFSAASDGACFHAILSSPGSGPFDGPTICKGDPDSDEPVSIDFDLPASE